LPYTTLFRSATGAPSVAAIGITNVSRIRDPAAARIVALALLAFPVVSPSSTSRSGGPLYELNSVIHPTVGAVEKKTVHAPAFATANATPCGGTFAFGVSYLK